MDKSIWEKSNKGARAFEVMEKKRELIRGPKLFISKGEKKIANKKEADLPNSTLTHVVQEGAASSLRETCNIDSSKYRTFKETEERA